MPRVSARSRRSLSLAAVFAALMTTACGASQPRSTMPTGQSAWLELLPRDAYFMMHADIAAARETPHAREWMQDVLEEGPSAMPEPPVAPGEPLPGEAQPGDEQDDRRRFIEGIDHVVMAIGGLVAAPHVPEEPGERGPEHTRMMQEAAEALGGRIPTAVIIFEGSAALEICQEALGDAQTRQIDDHVVGLRDGTAYLMKGQTCTITAQSAYSSLLEARAQPLPVLLSRTTTVHSSDPAAQQLVGLALDLESESFRAFFEAWREAQQQEQEESAAPGEEGEDGPPGDEALAAFMRQQQETMRRLAIMGRVALRVLFAHVALVDWQMLRVPNGYEFVSHTAFDDSDRAIMWREASQMYLDMMRGWVEEGAFEDDHLDAMRAYLDAISVEEEGRDAFVYRYTLTDAWIAQMREAAESEQDEPDPTADSQRAQSDIDADRDFFSGLLTAADGPSEGVIAALEPAMDRARQARVPSLYGELAIALADAYLNRGRYSDAIALLADAERTVREAGPDINWELSYALDIDNRLSPCFMTWGLCEAHLEYGFAEQAYTATQGGSAHCANEVAQVRFCRVRALDAQGRAADAETELRSAGAAPMAWAEHYLATNRPAQAYAVANSVCPDVNTHQCIDEAGALAEIVAAWAPDLATGSAAMATLVERHVNGARGSGGAQRAILVSAADCTMRRRVAPRAEATEAACRRALTTAQGLVADNHPSVAMARIALAETLRARRNRAGEREQRAAAQPIIETLGPQHPLRR